MRIVFLLCLLVFSQLASSLPVHADGTVGGSFTVRDNIPPAAVDDLIVAGVTPYSVELKWVAPGDNGDNGTANEYDIRYSPSPISSGTKWAASTPIINNLDPKPAGSNETLTIEGLLPLTTYYFALKTADEIPNWSGLSNYVGVTTPLEYLIGGDDDIKESQLTGPRPLSDPVRLDIQSKKGVVYLDLLPDGSLAHTLIITLDKKNLEITLQKGTVLTDQTGQPVSVVVLESIQPFGTAPAGFDFQSTYSFQPSCVADTAIILKMRYNRERLPEGANERDVTIAYYSQNRWVPLPSTADSATHYANTRTNHFSFFSLIVPQPGATVFPPDGTLLTQLNVKGMTVSSNIIEQGESVLVDVSIANNNNYEADFYLPLLLNGATLDTKYIKLTANQETVETFSVVLDEEGYHTLGVGPVSTTVTVKKAEEPTNLTWLRVPLLWMMVGGVIVMFIVAFINRRMKNGGFFHRF